MRTCPDMYTLQKRKKKRVNVATFDTIRVCVCLCVYMSMRLVDRHNKNGMDDTTINIGDDGALVRK